MARHCLEVASKLTVDERLHLIDTPDFDYETLIHPFLMLCRHNEVPINQSEVINLLDLPIMCSEYLHIVLPIAQFPLSLEVYLTFDSSIDLLPILHGWLSVLLPLLSIIR